MKIEKIELVRFEVPTDNVSLWVIVDALIPYYFVEFNGETIGSRDESFKRIASIYRNIRKVIQMQNISLYCVFCYGYVVGTKEYQLNEESTESLCPKCLIKAKNECTTVTEVS